MKTIMVSAFACMLCVSANAETPTQAIQPPAPTIQDINKDVDMAIKCRNQYKSFSTLVMVSATVINRTTGHDDDMLVDYYNGLEKIVKDRLGYVDDIIANVILPEAKNISYTDVTKHLQEVEDKDVADEAKMFWIASNSDLSMRVYVSNLTLDLLSCDHWRESKKK